MKILMSAKLRDVGVATAFLLYVGDQGECDPVWCHAGPDFGNDDGPASRALGSAVSSSSASLREA